jgi:cyclohexanone monooxygenase
VTPGQAVEHYDAVVIGAGFGGLYALHRLRDRLGLSVHAVERGDGVGGTWYWNRNPGARCDAESLFYSYGFDDDLLQDWTWTERFATQPEILSYAEHVADRFDLRRDISLCTSAVSAVFHDATAEWEVTTDTGRIFRASVVSAVGCLSASQVPAFEGLDSFQGQTYHTGRWPHEGVDFTGRTVAVIGTGSSAIQAIPEIAKQARHLTVFQRTPSYSVPAQNRPIMPDGFMYSFADNMGNEDANAVTAEYIREKIRETVRDPRTAELLFPNEYPVGAKRICVDTNYYATYNRDNVTLVSVKQTPIERITRTGVRVDGVDHDVDAIVFATGYDAMTGPLLRMDIRGRDGRRLQDAWADGPKTLLGVAVADFPNLFIVTGPGSPSVLTNMISSIEQHVNWIVDYITFLRQHDLATAEATHEAQEAWVAHVNEIASYTLFPRAASWYLGANIPGKTQVFMPCAGGLDDYRRKCDAIANDGYSGFMHTTAPSESVTASIDRFRPEAAAAAAATA